MNRKATTQSKTFHLFAQIRNIVCFTDSKTLEVCHHNAVSPNTGCESTIQGFFTPPPTQNSFSHRQALVENAGSTKNHQNSNGTNNIQEDICLLRFRIQPRGGFRDQTSTHRIRDTLLDRCRIHLVLIKNNGKGSELKLLKKTLSKRCMHSYHSTHFVIVKCSISINLADGLRFLVCHTKDKGIGWLGTRNRTSGSECHGTWGCRSKC